MQNLPVTEYKGIRVLTTKQLAEAYGTTSDVIGYNFRYNKNRYKEGKHYIMLEKQALRDYKTTNVEIQRSLPRISKLYLWTEKGALLHAKSLNTDKAWEVYDYLVDYYFRSKESREVPVAVDTKPKPVIEPKPYTRTVVDVPENPEVLKAIQKIRNDLTCMDVLLQNCICYTEEKAYNRRQKAAAEVLPIIVEDWNKFFDAEPKIIQKTY